jgi:hypothetical protein
LEFRKFGELLFSAFVRPNQAIIGCEPGNLFLEFKEESDSIKAKKNLEGREFDGRRVKIIFIPEVIFEKNFKPYFIGSL